MLYGLVSTLLAEVSCQELHPLWSPSLWPPGPLAVRACVAKSELPGPPLSLQCAAEAKPAEPMEKQPMIAAAAIEVPSFLRMSPSLPR